MKNLFLLLFTCASLSLTVSCASDDDSSDSTPQTETPTDGGKEEGGGEENVCKGKC